LFSILLFTSRKITWEGKVSLINWSSFIAKKNIYDQSTDKLHIAILNLYKNKIETFMLIQEIVIKDNFIALNGWSKESHDWLMYELIDAKVEIIELV